MRKPSPATALAFLALMVSLGGTALAAGHFMITNVNQIKPSVVRELTAPGRFVITHGNETRIEPGHFGGAESICLPGYHIVSGGYLGELSPGARLISEGPTSRGWELTIDNVHAQGATTLTARALCAPGVAKFEGPVK